MSVCGSNTLLAHTRSDFAKLEVSNDLMLSLGLGRNSAATSLDEHVFISIISIESSLATDSMFFDDKE